MVLLSEGKIGHWYLHDQGYTGPIEQNVYARRIRCDNAGEKISFASRARQEGLGVDFEYTSPHTPQQNGKIERAFPALYGDVRAMMLAVGKVENACGRF